MALKGNPSVKIRQENVKGSPLNGVKPPNMKGTRWKKKKTLAKEAVWAKVEQMYLEEAEKLVKSMLKVAHGNEIDQPSVPAIKDIMDRIFGKPKETVALEGTLDLNQLVADARKEDEDQA